jgi:hypothetical protein
LAVVSVEDEAGDIVVIGVDERTVNDFLQGQIGEFTFGGDALAVGTGSDSGQVVSGFFFVGFGEEGRGGRGNGSARS